MCGTEDGSAEFVVDAEDAVGGDVVAGEFGFNAAGVVVIVATQDVVGGVDREAEGGHQGGFSSETSISDQPLRHGGIPCGKACWQMISTRFHEGHSSVEVHALLNEPYLGDSIPGGEHEA